MYRALRMLFNLRYGEGQRVRPFFLLGLIWGTGCYGTLTLIEGLFLESNGFQSLPKVYFFSSLLLCSFSGYVLRDMSRRKTSPQILFLCPIILTIISNILLIPLLQQASPNSYSTILFIYRIFTWALTIFSYTTFWGFVDQFFNLQDGKRCFSIFNAVIFLGDALGSGCVAWLIQTIKIHGLLILFTSFLCLSIPIIIYISKMLVSLSDDHNVFLDIEHPLSIKETIGTYLKDKFTLCLIIFYFSMQLLAIGTEFNYLKVFETNFSNSYSSHELTSFLGKCALWISFGNMFFALFIYSRLIKKIKINNIILLAPVCFLNLFLFWQYKTTLTIATLGMVMREGLTYALDDNNLQLLIYGVPNKIRSQVRITIESIIEPVGMFAWSLIFFCISGKVSVCLIIAILATITVFFLRSYYPKAIINNISSNVIRISRNLNERISLMPIKDIRQIELRLLNNLMNQNENNKLFVLQHLLILKNRKLLPTILANINKLSELNKIRILKSLKTSPWSIDPITLNMLKQWYTSSHQKNLQSAVHMYFAEHGLLQTKDIVEDLHTKPSKKLIAAILTVQKTKDVNYMPLAQKRQHELLESTNLKNISLGISLLCLDKQNSNFDYLLRFIEHYDENIQILAAKGLSYNISKSHKDYYHQLIDLFKKTNNKLIKEHLLDAIKHILCTEHLEDFLSSVSLLNNLIKKKALNIVLSLDEDISSCLLEILHNENIHNHCRILAAKILSKKNDLLLKKSSYKIIKSKVQKIYFYAYHRDTIQTRYPHYNLNLLTHTLTSNYESELNFILEFMGILSSSEHTDALIRALIGKNLKSRAQALEALEKSCDNTLFSMIEPLVYNNVPNLNKKRYLKLGIKLLNLKELLYELAKTPVLLNQLTARQLKEELILLEPDLFF